MNGSTRARRTRTLLLGALLAALLVTPGSAAGHSPAAPGTARVGAMSALGFGAGLASPAADAASAVSSSFSTGAEGWRVGNVSDGGPYDVLFGMTDPQWSATAGPSSNGTIYMTDPAAASDYCFDAPAAYLGDKGAFYGGQLRYQIKNEGTGPKYDGPEVILVSQGTALIYDRAGFLADGWQQLTVPVTAGTAWHVGSPTGPTPTPAEFLQVLGNLTGLRIDGESRIGSDTGWLANVSFAPAPGVVRTPDARIRLGTGAYVGNNIYNTTGLNQTKTGAKARGNTIKFGISVQNDGTAADSFKLLATGTASAMYTVTYWHGTTNITTAVVAGTFTTLSLAPGATYLVTAKVKVNSSATTGSSTTRLVTITSVGDGTKQDAVSFTGKRL